MHVTSRNIKCAASECRIVYLFKLRAQRMHTYISAMHPSPAPLLLHLNTKPTGPPIKTDGTEIIYEGVHLRLARIFNFGRRRVLSVRGDKTHLEITLRYEYDVTRIPDELSRTRKLYENFHRVAYLARTAIINPDPRIDGTKNVYFDNTCVYSIE